MPIVDMSVEKLKVYQGVTPCPEDFDAFWDKSLEEIKKLDPKLEFTPFTYASKIADCYELRFQSTKGATIYAKFARPKKIEGKIPAVIHIHGLSGASLSWKDLMAYVSQNFVMCSIDVRGQGGKSLDVGGVDGTTFTTPFTRGLDGKPEDLLMRDVFLDNVQLAKIIMNLPYVDEKRVGVYGGSQGGGLSLATAALVPEIKLCAAMYPYLCDYKRVWNMDLAKGAYEGLKYYFRNFDPTHEHEDEIFTKLGYIDVQNLTKRIKAKVLMQTGLMDTTCPPSTQFAAYNKITSEKQVILYPDFGHEGLKGGEDRIFEFLAQL